MNARSTLQSATACFQWSKRVKWGKHLREPIKIPENDRQDVTLALMLLRDLINRAVFINNQSRFYYPRRMVFSIDWMQYKIFIAYTTHDEDSMHFHAVAKAQLAIYSVASYGVSSAFPSTQVIKQHQSVQAGVQLHFLSIQ